MVLGSQKEKWLHSPEHFINGKVTYHVKFVGLMEVDDPRDMDGMQSALQKLKFSQHIKRSEGQKAPKVDFSISVHGLTIVEPRTKEILHEIPLNHVSFCADDIQDKRLFSFIAKRNDKFYCYGLDSAHQANQITLTIGQAFDLALHRMNKTETNLSSLQVMELKKRIDLLQEENSTLKERIRKLQTPTQNTKASVAKSASSQSTRDVFDMQPFIEPMVQLSSPKEVYPGGPLSQTRHSTHMQANRFGRQRFEYELESTNELKGQGANAQHPVAENTFVLQKLLQSPNLSALLALVEQIQPDTYTSHSSTQQQHSLTETTSSDAATAQLINISNQEEEPTTNHVQQHEETSHQTNDSYTRKFKILEEGFSKGLAMEEAEIWLDDFDPLKNNNNK